LEKGKGKKMLRCFYTQHVYPPRCQEGGRKVKHLSQMRSLDKVGEGGRKQNTGLKKKNDASEEFFAKLKEGTLTKKRRNLPYLQDDNKKEAGKVSWEKRVGRAKGVKMKKGKGWGALLGCRGQR